MRTTTLAVAALLALLIAACTARSSDNRDKPPTPAPPQVKQLAGANNEFGLEVLRRVHKPGENVAVSPTSIAMILQLTALGAKGETRDEMVSALQAAGIPLDASNRALIDNLAENRGVTLNIANSLWVDPSRMRFQPAFTELAQTSFDAAAREEDFGNPATVGVINKWVADRTANRIPELLDRIGQNVGAYLINAVYFKGDWHVRFDKRRTDPRDFHLQDGRVIQVPTMSRSKDYEAATVNGTVVVRLTLGKHKAASMLFVLPAKDSSVEALLANLDTAQVKAWQEALHPARELLELPRFTMRWKDDLGASLAAMGMDRAFDPTRADFSIMGEAGGERIYISRVLHEVFVEVNEEGAEAAAATAVEMEVTSAPMDPLEYRFDRPFVFMIVDDNSGSILFGGALYDPS